MTEELRAKLRSAGVSCTSTALERWTEKVRLSKITPTTRVTISGPEAFVYDGAKPEKALYVNGQWRVAEVPELTSQRKAG